VASAVSELPRWLALAPEQATAEIAALDHDTAYRGRWKGISPFVTASVVYSLYAFLRSPDDYFACVCTAIAAGGDVDTTAAMTGAIAGARVGEGALPRELVEQLGDAGRWTHAELAALAGRAHALVSRSGGSGP
jgi:ADP-ribosylglycohydrolase